MTFATRTAGACFGLVVGLMVLLPARGDSVDTIDSFEDAMESITRDVVGFLASKNDQSASVSVGSFVGPSPAVSSAGARIVLSLKRRLGSKVELSDAGKFNVTGRFGGETFNKRFKLFIHTEVTDALGSPQHVLRRKLVLDEDETIAFFGPSSLDLEQESDADSKADSSLVLTGVKKSEAVVDSILSPKAHVRNRIARTSKNGELGIELLRKTASGYESLALESDGKLAKFALNENDVYAVRIHNDRRLPIGVRLSIDGINVFALSQSKDYQGKDVTMALCPCSSSTIKGWHLSDSISAEFKVAHFAETEAIKMGVVESMGTVTARFYDATANAPLPCASCDEKLGTVRSRGFAPSRLGTKRGKEIEMNYATMDVAFGELLGSVSVRYTQTDHPEDLPPES